MVRTVSEPGFATAHGVGAGDINGDGRIDILNAYGWWEQPAGRQQAGAVDLPSAGVRPFGRAAPAAA